MTLQLGNHWHYEGQERWSWEAFLDDGGSGDLGNVDHVEYVLHPTFPDPVRTVKDPAGGFSLKTAGWGSFELKAFVYKTDGQKELLTHQVKLMAEPPAGTSTGT